MNSEKHGEQMNPGEMLFGLATSFMRARAICQAAKFGISDLIHNGVQHLDDMAEHLKVNPDALSRLMRALTSIDLYSEIAPQRYTLTLLSELMLEESPKSLKHCLAIMADTSWWDSWGDLEETIKTGRPAINRVLGMDYDTYLARHPQVLHTFQQCLSTMSQVNNSAILQAYNFSAFKTIVDVGGGQGELLVSILQKNPNSKGVLYDLEHVLQQQNSKIAASLPIDYRAGNFFEHVPAGGDLYILKQVLHDWNDEQALNILKNCQKKMSADTRLLIIETVLDDNITPEQSTAYFFDVHMMLTSEGRERTVSEFTVLLTKAGLHIKNRIQTNSSFTILECGQMK